ncbi:MAG: SAM-dependent methyltransferase [Steroidobacteraceae bacterium]
MSRRPPLLTRELQLGLVAARGRGDARVEVSLDLGRTVEPVSPGADRWLRDGIAYPYVEDPRERTVYHWAGTAFEPVARWTGTLVKLVSTEWGAPTFEIDGVKMLPTAAESPFEDARRKVDLVGVRGRRVLDTCGGLGYYASWCLARDAGHVLSFEKSADVRWLRELNPWSPGPDPRLELRAGDVAAEIGGLPPAAYEVVLHDPPRFALAGELYSSVFYGELARVLRRGGRLFHYTGAPNSRSRGRDLAAEVAARLRQAGFDARPELDGVLATRR